MVIITPCPQLITCFQADFANPSSEQKRLKIIIGTNLDRFMMTTFPLIVVVFSVLRVISAVLDQQPQHVHLSLGKDATEMMVTWLTFDAVSSAPIVEYGVAEGPPTFPFAATGWTTKFTDGGSEKRVMYIHRVLLQGMTPDTDYYYHTGGPEGWSDVFWFKSMKTGSDWSPRFAIFGDLGSENGQSIPRLQSEVSRGAFDAILHVGDMAYNLETVSIYDTFLVAIAYFSYLTGKCTSGRSVHEADRADSSLCSIPNGGRESRSCLVSSSND